MKTAPFSAAEVDTAKADSEAHGTRANRAAPRSSPELTLTNVTLTGNDAAQGGNLASTDNTATLYNTILVRPTYGGHCYNLNSTIENGGGNLQHGDSSCGSIPFADPKLLALADNEGPTLTMALGEGSAALEIGVAAQCPAADQRGVSRPQPITSTNCDAGAYESGLGLAVETTITTHPANPSNSTAASFEFTSSEAGSTFLCQYDDEPFGISCTSPTTIYELVDGSHTIWIWATDAAGNPDATPATFTWTIDTVPPNTTIISHPAYWSNNTTTRFTFSSTETRPYFMCKLDGSA